VDKALNLGAAYVDIRLEKYESESVSAEDGKPMEATYSSDRGVGVRALAGGSWGFSASPVEGNEEEVIMMNVEKAVKLAKAVRSSSKDVELAEVKPGDVVKSLLGKTIEIVNTDAEGRLILSKFLEYHIGKKPKSLEFIEQLNA
jgi:predicted Zn-dependent protease